MLIKILFPAIVGLACAFNANAQPRFTSQVLDSTVSIGYGNALADVDGDGKPDILLADKKQFVWYRNGDWKKFVMAEKLTEFDNVCIAARDIDGDGKAEVAVGAQWNPGETSNAQQSGSVHYLIRPQDPTALWKAVELHHEPTIHRMQWARAASGQFYLVVTPLHGVGNKNGQGAGVRILAYHFNGAPDGTWVTDMIDSSMHMTHNFLTVENNDGTGLYVAGKEGIILFQESGGTLVRTNLQLPGMKQGAGEISMGKTKDHENFFATIEPMHGNELVVYSGKAMERMLLDSNLKEGHALGVRDLLQRGDDQVVAGWRNPNREGKVGIKLYALKKGKGWESWWIDENGMACEDLKIMDLNGDGKPDIVASGRSTHNLKIYWNH